MSPIRILFIAALLALLAFPASAAPPARPFTGIGLLVFRPGPLAEATVSVYRQPGVGRIATLPWAQLPSLSHILKGDAGEVVATVTDKRGAWVGITYDAAGRKGWTLMERSWRYIPWKEYLKGRPVLLLPGLKSGFYILRQERSELSNGESVAGQELRIIEVQDEWCMVITPPGTSGWIRWRDPDGRILVSIGGVYGKSN